MGGSSSNDDVMHKTLIPCSPLLCIRNEIMHRVPVHTTALYINRTGHSKKERAKTPQKRIGITRHSCPPDPCKEKAAWSY